MNDLLPTDSDAPPDMTLCWLSERKSKAGTTYLSGLLGSAFITVLPTRATDKKGARRWVVKLREAPPRKAEDTKLAEQPNTYAARRDPQASPALAAASPAPVKDEIPF
jgi:hypothetical protein